MVQGCSREKKALSFFSVYEIFFFLIRQSHRYIKCVVKLEAPKNPLGPHFSKAFLFKWAYIQESLILVKLYTE